MDLMKDEPKSVLMAQDVPPVKEKCSDKPSYEAFRKRRIPSTQFEEREAKEANPNSRQGQSNSELYQIYQQCTPVPTFRFGKFATGKYCFQD